MQFSHPYGKMNAQENIYRITIHEQPSSLLVDGVRLGDDRDDVDLAVELLHADEVEALEAVAVRGYEVEARVDPGVVEAERCFAY